MPKINANKMQIHTAIAIVLSILTFLSCPLNIQYIHAVLGVRCACAQTTHVCIHSTEANKVAEGMMEANMYDNII